MPKIYGLVCSSWRSCGRSVHVLLLDECEILLILDIIIMVGFTSVVCYILDLNITTPSRDEAQFLFTHCYGVKDEKMWSGDCLQFPWDTHICLCLHLQAMIQRL